MVLLASANARGAGKPVYGGTLRVELRASGVTWNPAKWKPGTPEFSSNERLGELVFERLVSLDNYGRFQPQLATEWSRDAAGKRWVFTLRPGVKFSDGSPLTSGDVTSALQGLLPRGMQISATTGGVVIQATSAATDLLEMLSYGPYFVYKDAGQSVPLGTGPFVVEKEDPAGQRLRLRYNELCWSGRPFVDAIEVTLGVPPLRALLDVQLGRADLAELSADTARRAQQTKTKLWASAPVVLYALQFSESARSASEQDARAALEASLDREAMARVLLQKQAEPAAAFLPQWLSGYAFLFPMETNVEKAKALRAKLPVSAAGAGQPLRIGVETGNDLARLLAERAVVNARAAGLTLSVLTTKAGRAGDGNGKSMDLDAQLVAWRYSSLSPRETLEDLASAWKVDAAEGVPADGEARYAWEKRMMDERNLLPLVAVPDYAAVDARVRNWAPAAWGEWRLADVWLEAAENSAGGANGMGSTGATGAKP